jgi:hypothetical protein
MQLKDACASPSHTKHYILAIENKQKEKNIAGWWFLRAIMPWRCHIKPNASLWTLKNSGLDVAA